MKHLFNFMVMDYLFYCGHFNLVHLSLDFCFMFNVVLACFFLLSHVLVWIEKRDIKKGYSNRILPDWVRDQSLMESDRAPPPHTVNWLRVLSFFILCGVHARRLITCFGTFHSALFHTQNHVSRDDPLWLLDMFLFSYFDDCISFCPVIFHYKRGYKIYKKWIP